MVGVKEADKQQAVECEVRPVRGVVRQQVVDFVLFGVPFCGLFLWVIEVRHQRPGLLPWLLGAAVLVWGVAFYRQWHRMHRLRCPGCRRQLRRRTGPTGERVAFACAACRVVWDTGFTEAHEADG